MAPTKAEALRLCGPYLAGKYENYTDWGQSDELPDDDGKLDQAFDELIGDRFLLELARRGRRADHRSTPQSWNQSPYYEHGLGRHAAEATLDCMRLFAAEVAPKVKSGL